QEIGRELLSRVQQDLSPYGQIESNPMMEGRQMVMLIGPKKK
ncbi:MAG: translation initiation factor IF-3, partial [Steroidobacteraceae bacterium]